MKRFTAEQATKMTLDALSGPLYDEILTKNYKNIRDAASNGSRECPFESGGNGVNSNMFKLVKAQLVDDGYRVARNRYECKYMVKW